MRKLLLTTAYFPPISYVSEIRKHKEIIIEQWENYQKQSYRNRCRILTANGIMDLSVPVQKGENLKTLTKDILIDYSTNWQKLHFKSIESAYKNSPYYDYYEEYFIPYFQSQHKYLLDLNNKIVETLADILELNFTLELSKDYINEEELKREDYENRRESFHPKINRIKNPLVLETKPYHQTFSDRFSFVPDLSILDLIFNMGPESNRFL